MKFSRRITLLEVNLHVLGKVVTAHESLLTMLTLKVFLSSVSFKMAMELIRAGEFTVTEWPVANIRFLTSMSSEMSLKV